MYRNTSVLFAIAASVLAAPYASGQEYPAKTIRIIVPFTPGGGTAEAFDKLFRAEVVTLGKVIKASGAKPE